MVTIKHIPIVEIKLNVSKGKSTVYNAYMNKVYRHGTD